MLPWYLRLDIAKQTADALHFLHTVNKPTCLVHGDVKRLVTRHTLHTTYNISKNALLSVHGTHFYLTHITLPSISHENTLHGHVSHNTHILCITLIRLSTSHFPQFSHISHCTHIHTHTQCQYSTGLSFSP